MHELFGVIQKLALVVNTKIAAGGDGPVSRLLVCFLKHLALPSNVKG